MLLALLPLLALCFVSQINTAQAQSSIPGLTDGQQQCLANCIFIGLPAATNCDPNAVDPDVACFCGSTAYTSNVTACASTTCSICTTGGCNITANPLVDQCTGTGSGSSASGSPLSTSGSASIPSASSKSSSAPAPSGSAPPNSARQMPSLLKDVTLLTVALTALALVI
ncbi:hypothetical protein B0H16DRAFT_440248 [Mycena metata]|uniref:CFEM domain-containing protein n=1 Tax=Mycena metata TaxID=1033252 RepID=A0AAD7HDL5_9AGAR|nr:hypothetical protein B0H16DRAFT_440248 [Mycena metata]